MFFNPSLSDKQPKFHEEPCQNVHTQVIEIKLWVYVFTTPVHTSLHRFSWTSKRKAEGPLEDYTIEIDTFSSKNIFPMNKIQKYKHNQQHIFQFPIDCTLEKDVAY